MIDIYFDNFQDCKFLYWLVTESELPYACIIHDKDKFLEDQEPDENGLGGHKKGDLKKPHVHVVLTFPNQRYSFPVAKSCYLSSDRFTVPFSTKKSALIYLTHEQEVLKYQYSRDDVFGTLYDTLKEYPVIDNADPFRSLDYLVDFIADQKKVFDVIDLYRYARKNHLCATYKKNEHMLFRMVSSRNAKILGTTDVYSEIQEQNDLLRNQLQHLKSYINAVDVLFPDGYVAKSDLKTINRILGDNDNGL